MKVINVSDKQSRLFPNTREFVHDLHLQALATDAVSATNRPLPVLTYLRVEMVRTKPGMVSFLCAMTAVGAPGLPPTTVTLLGDREFGRPEGALAAAKTLISEMKKREDKSTDWSTIDAQYLANMVAPAYKTFVMSPSFEGLTFSTDALQ